MLLLVVVNGVVAAVFPSDIARVAPGHAIILAGQGQVQFSVMTIERLMIIFGMVMLNFQIRLPSMEEWYM